MLPSKSHQSRVPGLYDVSPYNFIEEVQKDFDFPDKIPICDATIRKIDNNPGSFVPYPVEDKLEIATLLDEMGVAQVGCNPMHFYGTPRNDAICEGIRAIAKKGFNFKLTGIANWDSWLDGSFEGHADRILDMGVSTIDVEGLGSENFRAMYLPDWTWDQIRDAIAKACEYVRSKDAEAGVALGDLVRGDLDFMINLMNFWISHGAERFFVGDSFGSLSPPGTRYFVKRLMSGLSKKVPIIYHPHDDTGLATAGAIAAASAGAWPEASVNGIGERAYLKMEEYVVSLELLYGVDTGLKLEKIGELCRLVERVTGIKNQPHKPVVGEVMYVPLFEEEYTHMLKGGGYISTSFAPEIVGEKPALVWWEGMMSPVTVRAKLDQLELSYTEAQVDKAVEAIRARLRELKEFPAFLSDDEAGEICRRALR